MKRLIFTLTILFVCCLAAQAQVTSQNARRLPSGSGAPTVACVAGPPFIQYYTDTSTSPPTIYTCKSGTWTATAGGAVAAPIAATYITQTPNAALTNEQALSLLATGIPLVTTTTGAISISSVTNDAQTKAAIVPNTAPSAGQILAGNAGGTAYAPVTVSGSGATITMSSAGVVTINAIPNASLSNSAITINGTSTSLGGTRTLTLASSDFANQGTTTTVLHGNAAGNPTWAAVALGTDVSGTLQAAQEPAHTGDVTNSAGSLALSIAANAVTLAKLATQATNTVLGNATSGTAVPTALAVGTCSTAGSALIWTTNTGFGCNTSITANTATTATNATNTAITDDTTTNATMYPTWVTTASSNQAQKVSSTKLTFNPSTGGLVSTLFNGLTITNNGTNTLSITAGKTLTTLKTISLTAADDTGVYTLPTGTKTLLATDGVGTSLTGIPYTLTGTANQVTLSAGTGNITFSLPQSIDTSASVRFGHLGLNTAASASAGIVYVASTASGTQYGADLELGGAASVNVGAYLSATGATSNYALQIAGPSAGANNYAIKSDATAQVLFAGPIVNTGITTDATHTDSSVCQDTTTHQFYSGSGAAGICLGTSSARFKNSIRDLNDGLDKLVNLRPRTFFYDKNYGDGGAHLQYGFIAEEMKDVLPSLVRPDANGNPQSIDYGALWPIMVKAIQDLNAKVERLENEKAAIRLRP